MNSIWKRLTYPIVCALFVLSLVFGAIFYAYTKRTFVRQFDAELESKARALATLVEVDEKGHIEMEFADPNMPEFISKESPQYYQVWLADGSVLKKSSLLGNNNLPVHKKSDEDRIKRDIKMPSGGRGRMVVLKFHPQLEVDEKRPYPPNRSTPKATIALARDRHDLDETLWGVLLTIGLGSLLLPTAAAGVVYFGVRWGLRPVRLLTYAIDRIESPTGFRALPVEILPVELKPISRQLNVMMSRLKSAFDRERQFTLDASHELRTPLSETRTALEVALKWPGDKELMATSCKDALDATKNMEGLVAALLSLARTEAGLVEPSREPVDLKPLLES